MFKNRIDAVIFDLDGTLIDTEKIYRIVWPRALRDMGYEMTDEQYLAMRSLGRPFAPRRMKEWFGDDFDYDTARTIRKKYFNEYISEHGIDVRPGAHELLDFLGRQNIITAIATATDLERATEYLRMTSLDGYFDRVISAVQVQEGKPSPYVYLFACEKLSRDPGICLAVEDAPNGIIAAKAAGMHVAMVPDQSQPDEEIMGMIDCCVDSLDKLIEMF